MSDPLITTAETDLTRSRTDPESHVETERQERMKKFADDRMERVRTAKAERAAELARAEQEKMAEARNRLAGFEDVETARAAIARARILARVRTTIQFGMLVVLPTILAAIYLSTYATPFYEARTTFTVRAQEEIPGRRQTSSGIFGVTSPDGLHAAFLARAYMMSPEMLDALNHEAQFLERVGGENIDPVSARRLPYLSAPAPFATYQRYVRTDIDIQAGLLTLIVRGPTPNEANLWASMIINLTRTRIDELEHVRMSAALAQARAGTEAARDRLQKARSVLTGLQTGSGETDPHTRIAMTYQLIAELESEHQAAERELTALRIRYGNDNILVQRRATEAGLIEKKLEEYRNSIGGSAQNQPLAARAAIFDQAILDVELAQATWSERLRSEEVTRLAAKRDRAVLTVIVAPHSQDRPVSPDILKTSVLAFIVLAGIYIFLTILAASFRHHDLHR